MAPLRGLVQQLQREIERHLWQVYEMRPITDITGLTRLSWMIAKTALGFLGNKQQLRFAWSWQKLVEAMSNDDLKAEVELLRKENAALRKEVTSALRLKVNAKGAVSVYGLRRFPLTLYKEQWLKLLDRSSDIRAFIAANKSQLKAKDR